MEKALLSNTSTESPITLVREDLYTAYCEELHSNWLKGKLTPSGEVKSILNFDALPEPYLTYRSGTDNLYFLSTNPGQVNDFQKRDHILKNFSFIKPQMSYADCSKTLANHYQSDAFRKKSKSRIEKQLDLANLLQKNGLITLECVPYHSDNLPNKAKFLKIKDKELSNYYSQLKNYCSDKSIIYISACSTRKSISKETVLNNDWLKWVSNIINIDHSKASIEPITTKEGKITCALYFQKDQNGFRAISLMMGSNNLPSDLNSIRNTLLS